jgi:hypothetical protein
MMVKKDTEWKSSQIETMYDWPSYSNSNKPTTEL